MAARPASTNADAGPQQVPGGLTPTERLADPEARLQHAMDIGYRYLSRRDRTVREVRQRLEHERVEPATIDAAVASLREAGYLDDARYAQRFAEDRRELDGWGAARIERKLQAVGVASELIAVALAAQGAADEGAAALATLRQRFPAPPATPRDRERALGFLVRKGYAVELAHETIRVHGRDAT